MFRASPHANDAHSRPTPTELYALAHPFAYSIFAEGYLAPQCRQCPPMHGGELGNRKRGGGRERRTRVQRTSPEEAISTVPRTRARSGGAAAVCQSPETWIVGRPGQAAGARV